MNFPREIIENVAWKLEDAIRNFNELDTRLLNARADYDHIVLLDQDSDVSNLKPDSRLLVLKKAIHEFDQTTSLKNDPLVLSGGWRQSVTYFPGFCSGSSTGGTSAVSGAAEPAKCFKSIFDFNYPGLDELDKGQDNGRGQEPIHRMIPGKKSDVEVRQEDEKKANIAMIPVVNRSIKPNLV